MHQNDPKHALAQWEQEWIEHGDIHTTWDAPLPEDDETCEAYNALLLTERLLRQTPSTFEEKLITPTERALAHGFEAVIQRTARSPAQQSTHSTPWWQQFFLSGQRWMATAGAFAALMLFVWTGWQYAPLFQGYVGTKGNNTKQYVPFRLTFGVGSATSNAPQKRGKDGMSVRPASKLYFSLQTEKKQLTGYLYIYQLDKSGHLSLLYPMNKHNTQKMTFTPKPWVLNLKGVVLRYPIPRSKRTLGFFAWVQSKPMTSQQHATLSQRTWRGNEGHAITTAIQKALKLPSPHIDAFFVKIVEKE
ncbi:MAG: hypothetical protein CL920_25440 [Deltaproteobacteria bacterium]|nr:hypothetical protein [Deltaproteobacteria bacterium]|tara:strand:- start:1827 stop:2735 length:909 start_codon:yes stop_codon:yes gene_type:complete